MVESHESMMTGKHPLFLSVSPEGIDFVLVLDASAGMGKYFGYILKKYLEPLISNNTHGEKSRWALILVGDYFPASKTPVVTSVFTNSSQSFLQHLSKLAFANGGILKNAHHEGISYAIQFLAKIQVPGRSQHCIFVTSTLSHLHGTRLDHRQDLVGIDIYQAVSKLTNDGVKFSYILCRKSMESLQRLEEYIQDQRVKDYALSDSEFVRISEDLTIPLSISNARKNIPSLTPVISSDLTLEKKGVEGTPAPIASTIPSSAAAASRSAKKPKVDPGTPLSVTSPPPIGAATPSSELKPTTSAPAKSSKKAKKDASQSSPKKSNEKLKGRANPSMSPAPTANVPSDNFNPMDLQKSVQNNQQSLLALHAQIQQQQNQHNSLSGQVRPPLTLQQQQQLLQRIQQQQKAQQDHATSGAQLPLSQMNPQLGIQLGTAGSPNLTPNRPNTNSPSMLPAQLNPQMQAVLKAQQLIAQQQTTANQHAASLGQVPKVESLGNIPNNALWSGQLAWTGNDPVSKQTRELLCNVTAAFPPSRLSSSEDVRNVHWPSKLVLTKTIPFKDELFNRLLANQSLPIVHFSPINQAAHVSLYRTLLMNLAQNSSQTTLAAIIYFPATPPFNGQQGILLVRNGQQLFGIICIKTPLTTVIPQIENVMRSSNLATVVNQQQQIQPPKQTQQQQAQSTQQQLAQQVQQLTQQNQQQTRQLQQQQQQQQLVNAMLNNPALLSQLGTTNIQALLGQQSAVRPQLNLQANLPQAQQQQQNNLLATMNLTPQQLAAIQQQFMRPPNM